MMSRDIKFRAWLKNAEIPEMIFDHEMRTEDFSTLFHSLSYWNKGAELMQFTGLRDLEGVDIYEGDIVSFSSSWSEFVCAVEFYDGAFRFGKQIKGSLGIYSDADLFSFTDGSGCDGYIVIGNIYQNPELLERLR